MANDHRDGGGALYRLDRFGQTELMLGDLTIPNGLGWSPDGQTMYLVDSGPRVVYAFVFDPGRGTIAGSRVLVTIPEEVGAPDGMTVDATGDIWVAIYGGGRVHRYSPDGGLLQVIPSQRADHLLRLRGGRDFAGSTSPPQPRTGARTSVAPSPPPESSTGATRTRSASRPRRSVLTPTGGRR